MSLLMGHRFLLIAVSGSFSDLTAHHELCRCLLHDIKAVLPVESKGEIDVTATRLDWPAIQSSGRMGQLTTHHQRGVGLPDDLKAMALIEPKSWIILEHEQCHRLCRLGAFVQQPHDL